MVSVAGILSSPHYVVAVPKGGHGGAERCAHDRAWSRPSCAPHREGRSSSVDSLKAKVRTVKGTLEELIAAGRGDGGDPLSQLPCRLSSQDMRQPSSEPASLVMELPLGKRRTRTPTARACSQESRSKRQTPHGSPERPSAFDASLPCVPTLDAGCSLAKRQGSPPASDEPDPAAVVRALFNSLPADVLKRRGRVRAESKQPFFMLSVDGLTCRILGSTRLSGRRLLAITPAAGDQNKLQVAAAYVALCPLRRTVFLTIQTPTDQTLPLVVHRGDRDEEIGISLFPLDKATTQVCKAIGSGVMLDDTGFEVPLPQKPCGEEATLDISDTGLTQDLSSLMPMVLRHGGKAH